MSETGRYIKMAIPLIIFIMIAVFLWRSLKTNPHKIPSPLIGKSVPVFSASSLFDAKQIITNQNLTGKVSILNVFATWCMTCHAEHPVLMDIHDSHRVNIYGLDYKDNRAKAKAWLAKYGDPYTKVIFDPKGLLGINLGVYGTPETFIIDQKGIIRYKHIGAVSPDVWKDDMLPRIIRLEKQAA